VAMKLPVRENRSRGIIVMAIAKRNFLQRSLLYGVVSACVVYTLLDPPQIRAQSPTTTDAPLPSFEVASIKPNHSGGDGHLVTTPEGRLIATNITAKTLIAMGYSGTSLSLRDEQISGGPSWISSERYDIGAQLEDSEVEAVWKLPPDQRYGQIRLRVRSLLADRFKLEVKHETKEVPVYALVNAKNGPKLPEAKPGDTYPNGIKGSDGRSHPGMMRIEGGQLIGQALPMAYLAAMLSHQLGRTVLDQTGLTGGYDFVLKWTPDQSPAGMVQGPDGGKPSAESAPPPDSSGPSIFSAIQEQLGLKLESTKGPVEVIVIDHIERPSEN
jgi:bla regulator protein blaR1